MKISRVTADDKSEWLPLWQAYLDFYRQDLSTAVTEQTFARFLEKDEPMFLHVARREGRLVGFASFILHRSTWAKSYYCYLEDLYVDEAARGRGVARALIGSVAQDALSWQAERLYWVTQEGNAAARALYDKVAKKNDFVTYMRDL